jgi:hypothetical protein
VEYESESYGHSDVYILPLMQAMHYLPFHRSGTVKITSLVLWGNWHQMSAEQLKEIKEIFPKRINMSSPESLKESMERNRLGNGWNSIIGEELMVIVPDGVFAKEPSKFEKWWVNLWFESKPKDQCHFRKRRMLAYSIQPIVVSIWLIIEILIRFWLAFVETMAGFKDVSWEDILHPFSANIEGIYVEKKKPKK